MECTMEIMFYSLSLSLIYIYIFLFLSSYMTFSSR